MRKKEKTYIHITYVENNRQKTRYKRADRHAEIQTLRVFRVTHKQKENRHKGSVRNRKIERKKRKRLALAYWSWSGFVV